MQKLGWIPHWEHMASIKTTILFKGVNEFIDIPTAGYLIKFYDINTIMVHFMINNSNIYSILLLISVFEYFMIYFKMHFNLENIQDTGVNNTGTVF